MHEMKIDGFSLGSKYLDVPHLIASKYISECVKIICFYHMRNY
jgi:hypothetical protein